MPTSEARSERDEVNVHLAYLRRVATPEEVNLLLRLAERAPSEVGLVKAIACIARTIDQQGRVGLQALLSIARNGE